MHSPAPPPHAYADRVSLLQQSALVRIGLAVLMMAALWLAIAWAISLP